MLSADRRLPPSRHGPGTGARYSTAARARLARGDGAGPRPVHRTAGDVRAFWQLDHGEPRVLVPVAARSQACAGRDGTGLPTRRGALATRVLAGVERPGLRQRWGADDPLGR